MEERVPEIQRWDWMGALRSRVFVFVVIPLLWAAAYLPGLGVRDLMHEEGRRAEPAAEMLRTGDWVTPRLYGEAYLNKPPLFFWMAAVLGKMQGRVNELSVRIPSVVSALLGAWLVVGFARRDLRREVRVLAGLILLSMPVMLDKGALGEIDAVLSLETFASIAVLWAGWDVERGRIAMWAWVVSGVCMGIGALTKGPGGAIEFYGVIAPFLFLVGRGRWKLVISPGHFVMIFVALVPVLVWAGMMLSRGHVGSGRLVGTWMDQLDFDLVPGMKKQVADGGVEEKGRAWAHYKTFGVNAFSMLLPWSMLGVAGAFRWVGRRLGVDRRRWELWVLLAVSGPALLVLFWAWPGANARYMMMVVYPVSVLSAWLVVEGREEGWAKWMPTLRTGAVVLAVVLAAGAVVAVVTAVKWSSDQMGETCAIAVVAMIVAKMAMRLTRRSPMEQSGIAFAAMLAIVVMVGWGLGKSVFSPVKAKTDATRRLHEQIVKVVPVGNEIYTTRTLSGGRGNNYFNAQFYLPGGATGVKDFGELPVGRKVTVVMVPEEMENLRAVAAGVRELGRLEASNGPPVLVVVEVTR